MVFANAMIVEAGASVMKIVEMSMLPIVNARAVRTLSKESLYLNIDLFLLDMLSGGDVE